MLQSQVDFIAEKCDPNDEENPLAVYSRSPGQLTPENIDQLLELFATVPPLTQDVVVYRGIGVQSPDDVDFSWGGIVSTSTSWKVANRFATTWGVILVITLPIGAHVIPTWEAIPELQEEREIIFNGVGSNWTARSYRVLQ